MTRTDELRKRIVTARRRLEAARGAFLRALIRSAQRRPRQQ